MLLNIYFLIAGRSKNYTPIHRRFSNPSSHNENRRQLASSNSQETVPLSKCSTATTTVENVSNHLPNESTTPNSYSSTNIDTHSRSNHCNPRSDRYGSYRSNGAYGGGSSAYRRRPFSSNNRYYGGNTRSTFRIHRTAETDADGNVDKNKEPESKTLFNEGK